MSEKIPAPNSAFEAHETAEGAESSGRLGSRSALQDMLLSTEPSTPLEMIESPWAPDQGGVRRIYRGIQKMTGASGTPAIADLLIGMIEVWYVGQRDDDETDENSQTMKDVLDRETGE